MLKAPHFVLLSLFGITCIGCLDHDTDSPPNISGTYVLQVSSKYGTTADTIEVSLIADKRVYNVLHKVEFAPTEHDRKHNRTFQVERHVATFEEHQSVLQDVEDGTVFLINQKNRDFDRSANAYKKIR